MNYYEIVKRPIYTEKAVTMKEQAPVICFEVHPDANKTQIREAVSKLFGVKIAEVRTLKTPGKLRRRGKFAGYRSETKKAYVRLRAGEKVPEFAEV